MGGEGSIDPVGKDFAALYLRYHQDRKQIYAAIFPERNMRKVSMGGVLPLW